MAMTPLHATIGIGIASIIPEPITAIIASFLSHFVADLYPEWWGWDPDKKEYNNQELAMGFIEFFLAICVIIFLYNHNWVLSAAAIAANIPDLWEIIYKLIKRDWTKSFWFCHGGYFPFRVSTWQGFGMRALQTSFLDAMFITIILILAY